MASKQLTQSELGRRGGNALFKKRGRAYYSKIAKLRWSKEKRNKK